MAALIILIRKCLNRSKISSLVENHLLTCTIRFCFSFFCFFQFFVNMLFFTKFCWNFNKDSLRYAFCSFFLKILITILFFIDFAFFLSSVWFLNNSNKIRKYCIVLAHCGNLSIVVYTYIFIFFLVRFVQSHLLFFCCKILCFWIFNYQKEINFRSIHILMF